MAVEHSFGVLTLQQPVSFVSWLAIPVSTREIWGNHFFKKSSQSGQNVYFSKNQVCQNYFLDISVSIELFLFFFSF